VDGSDGARYSTGDVVAPSNVVPSALMTFQYDDHFILGSPCKGGHWTIAKLLVENTGDAAFASFLTRVSVALKHLSPTDAIMINESYRVCNFHEVALAQATYTNYRCLGWSLPIPQSVL
jgi:hypothetical protein